MLCSAAGVLRTGYYYWLKSENTRKAREKADEADFALILWAYQYRGFNKGVMGIKMRLLRHPRPVNMNEKKIRRLMRKYGLECPIRKANPYRRMTNARKESDYAKNLSREKAQRKMDIFVSHHGRLHKANFSVYAKRIIRSGLCTRLRFRRYSAARPRNHRRNTVAFRPRRALHQRKIH